MIGNKEDYIENPYKSCYYDAEALQALINSRSAATWQEVANSLGITRTNLRNSLLSYTRLPVARFLAACDAFGIEPFFVIVDPNPQYINRGGEKVETTALGLTNLQEFDTMRTDFVSMRSELTELKDELESARREIAEMSEKLDLILGSHEKYPIAKRTKRIVSKIVQNAEQEHQQANKQIVND